MKRAPKVDLDAFHADLDTQQLAFVREHYAEFVATAANQQWDHLPPLARSSKARPPGASDSPASP